MDNKNKDMPAVDAASAKPEEAKTDDRAVQKKKPKVKLTERIAKGWREYKSELKKIVWYSREQTFKSSVIVVISIVVVSLFISVLDYLFSSGLMWIGSLV